MDPKIVLHFACWLNQVFLTFRSVVGFCMQETIGNWLTGGLPPLHLMVEHQAKHLAINFLTNLLTNTYITNLLTNLLTNTSESSHKISQMYKLTRCE